MVRGVPRATDYRRCENPARDTRGGFCDATVQWGASLTFARAQSPEEIIPGSVSAADFDGDGRVDLLVGAVQEAPATLLLNRGGRFEDATAAWGLQDHQFVFASRAADLDGDGDPDLVLSAERAPRFRVLRNTGSRFESAADLDPAANDAVFAMAVANLDNDGLLDLVLGDYSRPGTCPRFLVRDCPGITHAFRQTAPWTFRRMPVESPTRRTLALRVLDLDEDGAQEVYAVNDFGMFDGPNVRFVVERTSEGFVLRDRTAGSGFDAAIFGMGIGALDVDGDARDELLLTNIGRNVLLRREGARLVDATARLGGAAYGIAMEGAPPTYRAYDPAHPIEGPLARYAQSYLDPASNLYATTKWETVVADFDHDGWDDVFIPACEIGVQDVIPEATPQPAVFLQGTGRRLVDRTVAHGLTAQRPAQAAAPLDVDGDGDLDLALVRVTYRDVVGGLTLLRNDLPAGNVLRVTARGRGAMRDAIGAVVTARVGGRTLRRRVDGNLGTYGSRPPEVRIGMGAARVVDEVTVRFPSGRTVRRTGVPAGALVLDEGQGA